METFVLTLDIDRTDAFQETTDEVNQPEKNETGFDPFPAEASCPVCPSCARQMILLRHSESDG